MYETESKAKIMRVVLTKLTTQLCELLFTVDDSNHIFCLC